MRELPLVFIDCETSGLDPYRHEILEFAAVRMSPVIGRDGHSREVIEALVQIDRPLVMKCRMRWPEMASPEALAVNGYTQDKWKNAVDVRELLYAFSEYMGTSDVNAPIVVGQNTQFDWRFLAEAYHRERNGGFELPRTKYLVDIASIAWPLLQTGAIESIRLRTLCDWYGISNDGEHSALTDVLRTVKVYCKHLGLKLRLASDTW
jgi:DNA polymerase-3 subunit epsilon